MANPFEVVPVNALQAILAQRQGAEDAFQSQLRPLQLQEAQGKIRARDQLSQMLAGGGTPDYSRLALGALAAGDPSMAGVLSNIGNQNASRALQERSISLQEKQAEEKPQYQIIEDASGNKQIVKLEPYGRGASVVNPSGMGSSSPTNPYSTGKATEAQSKFQLYANRVIPAEQVIRDMEDQGTDWLQAGLSKLPFGVGNALIDPRRQALEQAQRDFINAVLRPESGAAISESEFENARRQYFPQPGDSKETIANKRNSRMEEIKGIIGAAGPAYKPSATFNEAGELVRSKPGPLGPPNASPSAMRQASALPPIQGAPRQSAEEAEPDPNDGSPAANLMRARIALKRGASPQVVARRLIEGGINPDELGLPWESR